MWRLRSLRWRLTFFYLALLSVLLLLFGVAQYFGAREVLFRSSADVLMAEYKAVLAAYRRDQERSGLPVTGPSPSPTVRPTPTPPPATVEQLCRPGIPASRCPLLTSTFAQLLASRRIAAAIISANGAIAAVAPANTPNGPRLPPLLSTGEYIDALQHRPKTYYLVSTGQPPAMQLAVLVPIQLTGRSAIGLAQLSIPSDEVEATLRLDRLLAGGGSVAVLLLALIFSPLIVGSTLRPLEQMAGTAGALAAGDYKQRVGLPHSKDEIRKLAIAFNEMAAGIEQAFDVRRQSEESMRQFVADASHELRTPLTAIAGYLDVLSRRDHVDPETLQQSLAAMQREGARMTRLVNDLLTLTRFESTRAPNRQPLTLDNWLAGTLDEMDLREQGVVETRTLQPGIVVRADPDALKQVVTNLAQNATKYASGAEQRWSCFQENGRAAIRLADTGPGIDPGDLPHIFERFYRGEKARDRSTGGSGLGLAIVRSIVEAHGGSIDAQSQPGKGATFTAWLPLDPPAR